MSERTEQTIPADVEDLATGTSQLLETAGGLSDADLRAPSLCVGWTRGHVLTHLARNADSLVNLLTWARTGVETPQYVSAEKRDADIEAGSGRPAAEIVADLEAAAQRLVEAIAEVPADRWDERLRMRSGREVPAARIPWLRRREVEIHHVDLDAGYTPAHWSPEFVERMLRGEARHLSERPDFPAMDLRDVDSLRVRSIGAGGPTVTGPGPALLAWLIGRSPGDGLTVEPAGALPTLPAWN
jgi:maleylpyruvate isomerase